MIKSEGKKIEINTDANSKNAYQFLSGFKSKYRIDHSILRFLSLIIGGISIYLGYLLFIKGVTGEASLVVNATQLKGQLLNAAPGLFFALSGVAIIFFALFKKEEIRIVEKTKKSSESQPAENGGLGIPTFLRKQLD